MTKTSAEVREFYDQYTGRQVSVGINDRHRSIHQWLLRFGMTKQSKILEIGCGIGTQTELVAEYLDKDVPLVAMDISPKSIDIAKERLKKYPNIQLFAADITEHDMEGKFDIILLPDVLEHIPIPLHTALFEKMASLLNEEGTIVIHMPNPYYLQWCHENRPHVLQVIDQPIYTDVLLPKIHAVGLYLHFLEIYSIWVDKGDYEIVILRKNIARKYSDLPQKGPTIIDKIIYKLSAKK